jgi:DNA-binding winged helix-turn-helix (wHTH) protein
MNTANVIPLGAHQAVPDTRSRRPETANPVRVRFDAFELDEPNALLLRNGQAVALPPKPFEVLCVLARTPGRLVTKNALLDLVWGHRFVTTSALKTAISDLRAALDDDPKRPRLIETVTRRGYRFIAPVNGAPRADAAARGRDDADGMGRPGLAVLTALCRGDAALADLIRAVAATLANERPDSTMTAVASHP